MTRTPGQPTAVLFDLDGTISASGETIVSTLHSILTEMGFLGLSGIETRRIVGPPLGQTLREIVQVPEEHIPEVVRRYRASLHTQLDRTPPFEGMLELIRELAATGLPLAVATSKLESMAVEVVNGYGIGECFVAICGSPPDESTGTKAAVVASALERLGTAGADLSYPVMVGDRHHDIIGAGIHGVQTIAVSWGYGEPSEWVDALAVVDSVAELGDLLRPGL
ncbi:HAD hydrolase-like protein [Austwickia chelonae]|uniref:HAD hydrolase-like protein n=1 Tax=Austwickia chelonae TaxID=100225 RepID=UPI0013C2C15C|nr:HAD hydrolase-like protein [Austwickia chelonae]